MSVEEDGNAPNSLRTPARHPICLAVTKVMTTLIEERKPPGKYVEYSIFQNEKKYVQIYFSEIMNYINFNISLVN